VPFPGLPEEEGEGQGEGEGEGAFRIFVVSGCPALAGHGHRPRFEVAVLLAFLALPLLTPFVYSLVRQPIYVVGRYDFIAHPAWLGLMGIGMGRLQEWLEGTGDIRRRLAGLLPAGAVLVLAVRALAPMYAPLPASMRHHPQTERGSLLAKHATKDDLIVCLGQEGAKIGYQMLLRDIPADMMTFPLSTRRHFGWFNPREVLEQEGPKLVQEAHAIVAQLQPPAATYKRLWLVRDPYSGRPPPPGAARNYYAEISGILYSAVGREKWTASNLGDEELLAQNLGIEVFSPAGGAK